MNNFSNIEHRSITIFWEKFPTLEALRTEKAKKCRSYRFLLRTEPFFLQNYLLHFVHQCINPHFSREKLLDSQRMHLVPCNGNLMNQTKQKLNIGLICRDIQSRFPSKQLSVFIPSTSQSTFVLLYKMIQLPCLLPYFLEVFNTPKSPNLYICMILLHIETIFFQSYRVYFFIKTSSNFWIVSKFETSSLCS